MKRRKFLGSTALFSLYASMRPGYAAAQADEPSVAPVDDTNIDPYFLDSGEITETEQESIADFERYRDQLATGKQAIMPRGGRPRRAPTFRFLHWDGEIDADGGKFVSPLSVKPEMGGVDLAKCELNAEILGFRVSPKDFPSKNKTEQGTLTVEFRVREDNEKMSWMLVQQFTAYEDGTTDLGMEHIAQRNELPQSIVLEDPTMDIRIQLMRHGTGGGFLRKVLKVAGMISGLGSRRGADQWLGTLTDLRNATPALRLPRLPKEGVALGQAVLSGVTKDRPLWASGYNSHWLTKSGGRMKLVKGIWVAIDESPEMKVEDLKVADHGGHVVLASKSTGKLVEANYLILDFQIDDGAEGQGSGGIIPKGDPTLSSGAKDK